MFTIQTMNKISSTGIDLFPRDKYLIADDTKDPDAILVRSRALHELVRG